MKSLKKPRSVRNKLFPIPYSLSSSKGFTLIELLVVFTVIAILSGVSLISLVSYSRTQEIQQVASNLKLLINQAKHSSISVVKTNQDTDGSTVDCGTDPQGDDYSLVGYSIEVAGNTQLVLKQLCEGNYTNTIKVIDLPPNLSFTQDRTCNQIIFSSLSSNVSGTPCSLPILGYGQIKKICVDTLGNTSIKEQSDICN